MVQTLDYYPYGSPRIKSGTDVSQREYIGQMYDEASNLSYLNARYYDGNRGQFLSEDPVFWALPSNILADPQQMNSYNYARSNPIRFSDPEGKSIEDFRGPYGSPPYQTGDLFGSYQGVNIYNNGGDSNSEFQCTQFVDRFMAANWGVDASNFSGNGKNYLAPNLNAQLGSDSDFTTSYNRQIGNILPTEDSIISFGPSDKSPYGHVAVVGAVNFNEKTNSGYIVLASQNTSKFNPKITVTKNANGAYQVANYSGMRALGWTTPASRMSSGAGNGTSGGTGQSNQSGVWSAIAGILRQISTILSSLK